MKFCRSGLGVTLVDTHKNSQHDILCWPSFWVNVLIVLENHSWNFTKMFLVYSDSHYTIFFFFSFHFSLGHIMVLLLCLFKIVIIGKGVSTSFQSLGSSHFLKSPIPHLTGKLVSTIYTY